MSNPVKKGTSPSTPNNQSSRKLDAIELELRRLGRSCEAEEDEPASCSVYHLAADRVQARSRRGARPAPTPEAPRVEAPTAAGVAQPAQEALAPAVQAVEAASLRAGTQPKPDNAPKSPDTTGSPFSSSYP